ncbi:MAG: SDR family NAD(P)-dependent oxidoreductase [Alphaproteobacteria bacterium]|nr:SDR family NAD(P)-dependent oxidoreductase [Alphaproteobacteria bacterium]
MIKNAQNILITGASSGIGQALAVYYSQNGVQNLFICGRNAERLDETVKLCQNGKVKIHSKTIDVKKQNEIADWIAECEKIAPLHLVIANAGVATLSETPENIYNTFSTNIFGVLHTVIPTIEIYKQRQDTQKAIAIISSIAGYHGLPSCPSYSASKACVKAWGEALRGDLLQYNIKVSTICPGFVRSRITDKNTCPMPFFWETEKAAQVIADRIDKNIGLIAFPWPVRFSAWFMSILPNKLSEFIYNRLPHKV